MITLFLPNELIFSVCVEQILTQLASERKNTRCKNKYDRSKILSCIFFILRLTRGLLRGKTSWRWCRWLGHLQSRKARWEMHLQTIKPRWLWKCNGTFWTPYQFNVFGKGPWKRMISFGHYPNYLPPPKFGQVCPFFFKAVRHCLIETKWEVSRVTLKWGFLRTTYKTVQRSQRSKHCHFWRNWLFLLIKIQLAKKGQNFGKAPPPILFFRDPSLSHNLHANHVIEGSKTFTGKARISRNIFSESWYFRFREVKLAGCCIPRNGTPPCSCIGVASQAAAATAGKFN